MNIVCIYICIRFLCFSSKHMLYPLYRHDLPAAEIPSHETLGFGALAT